MNATRTIALCAQLETKLDTVLFRRMEEELPPQESGSLAGTVAKGAAIAGGGYYAGSAIKRGLAPLVADRRSGMRATVDGFRDASPLMQNVRATGSVLGNNPLKSASAVGGTIAADARAVGSAAKNLAPVKGFLRARAKGVGVGGALKRGLGSGIKAVTRGRFGFQSLQSQVVEFAAELESVEFRSDEKRNDRGRNAAVGAVIGAGLGAGIEAQNHYRNNGLLKSTASLVDVKKIPKSLRNPKSLKLNKARLAGHLLAGAGLGALTGALTPVQQ